MNAACASLSRDLDGAAPDLAIAFASRAHQASWHRIPDALRDRFPGVIVVGCSASGVIGDGRELERGPGLAIAAAQLPGVELTPFAIPTDATPDPTPSGEDAGEERACWRRAIGIDEGPDPHLLLFPDPWSWTGPKLLTSLDRAFPSGVKIGGLSSGGARPGENRLFCDRSTHQRGLVGLAMRGNLEVETVVAQGCRPVGSPMFVTRGRGNIIDELDGRPAFELLRQLFDGLSPEDRKRARTSLFIGISMHPTSEVHDQGDFLVRNLVGIDPNTGAIAIGADLKGRSVVQFHVRDAQTSANELHELLTEHAGHRGQNPAHAALLFSCLGRGESLYGHLDHDSDALREHLSPQTGDLPIAGFFCNGEIGPIGGRTFMHGYTSAIVLVRPAVVI